MEEKLGLLKRRALGTMCHDSDILRVKSCYYQALSQFQVLIELFMHVVLLYLTVIERRHKKCSSIVTFEHSRRIYIVIF